MARVESTPSRRLIPFTVDGQSFTTSDPSLAAAAILRIAGLDPAQFDLGEVEGKEHPHTRRYSDEEAVTIQKDARFVSIRHSADVA